MLIILFIPILLLILDGYIAHWLVKKYIQFKKPIKHERLLRAIISILLFLILGTVTIYLLAINFRLER